MKRRRPLPRSAYWETCSMWHDRCQQRRGMCHECHPFLWQHTAEKCSNTKYNEHKAQCAWLFLKRFACCGTQVQRLKHAHIVEERDSNIHQHDHRQPGPSCPKSRPKEIGFAYKTAKRWKAGQSQKAQSQDGSRDGKTFTQSVQLCNVV